MECWKIARKEEIQALEKNDTWTMTTLPPQHKSIGVKWVYKIKRTVDDNVDHYKATLVENGYRQKYRIYYDKVFAPVVRFGTVRLIILMISCCAKTLLCTNNLNDLSLFWCALTCIVPFVGR